MGVDGVEAKPWMSRGMKGCYVYCADKETGEYFKAMVINEAPQNNEP